jgi:hypothetical protein
VQLGGCGSGCEPLALGALGFGDHFGGALGIAEGEQVRLLGDVSHGVVVERNALAVDDGVVAATVVGVLSHGFRIGRSLSCSGIGDVFGERTAGVVQSGTSEVSGGALMALVAVLPRVPGLARRRRQTHGSRAGYAKAARTTAIGRERDAPVRQRA